MKEPKSHEYKLTFDEVRYRQALPLEIKEAMSRHRIREFVNEYGEDQIAVSYSGGIDSTFALAFARKYYPRIRAISVIGIERKENIELVQKNEKCRNCTTEIFTTAGNKRIWISSCEQKNGKGFAEIAKSE